MTRSAAGEPVHICERCGERMDERKCKILCPTAATTGTAATREPPRVFLLSPATCGGERAQLLLLAARAAFPSRASSARADGAPLGEVFSFLSGLYFRGKLRLRARLRGAAAGRARRAGHHADARAASPEVPLTLAGAARGGAGGHPRRQPALSPAAGARRARAGRARCRPDDRGRPAGQHRHRQVRRRPARRSSASACAFPLDFVGRGDMSRGGLLLRCVAAGSELDLRARRRRGPPRRRGRRGSSAARWRPDVAAGARAAAAGPRRAAATPSRRHARPSSRHRARGAAAARPPASVEIPRDGRRRARRRRPPGPPDQPGQGLLARRSALTKRRPAAVLRRRGAAPCCRTSAIAPW